MRRKILALSLVLAMAASVLSPAAMAQTVSDSLPIVSVTSESTAESTSAAESVSTAESTSTAESVSTPASAPAAESTSDAVASKNTTAAQPQADEVAIDETNFPDANFREAVKQYDTDGNGSFSQAELDAVRIIDVSNKSIQTLKGIEHFRELLVLTADNNGIEQVDISHNIKLRSLSMNNTVYGIGLTELNTENNPELLSLSLQMNQLTQLDITKNQKLTSINVSWNQLTDIDLSRNTDLKKFEAIGNRLGNLDVSNNTSLESLNVSGQNPLESLDVTKNTELKLLYLNISHLQSLDLSNNVKLENLSLGVSREEADDGIESPLSSLDVSKNVALTELLVSDSQITSLDISNNLKIKRLQISNSQLKALDVSKNIELQTLWLSHNFLKELDLSNNAQLTGFSVVSNQLKFLDLSSNAALKSLNAVENPLMGLEVGGEISVNCNIDNPTQVSLTAEAGTPIDLKTYAPFFDASKVSNVQGGTIDANGVLTGWTSGSPVTYTYDAGFEQVLNVEITIQDEAQTTEVAIDETNFPDANFREFVKRYDTDGNGSFSQAELDAVTEINASSKEIQNLKGIEYFTALTSLNVFDNNLTSLDVSANTALESLDVSNNHLTSLDLSANTALTNLTASFNQLTELDLEANAALTILDVVGNQLTSLDVSANTTLESLSVSDNQLTSLDVSANTALQDLYVANNQLTALDVSANTKLSTLIVNQNQLISLKLGNEPFWVYTVDNPTQLSLTAKAGTAIDLKTYAPFFDASKVSNVQGGTIDANGVLTGWTSGSPVTYTYDAGFEKVLNVSIVIVDEDLKGLSLVANPFSKTYNGKAVTEQELIAGAKATYEGKEVSGKWSVENLPEMKDVGTYRHVLTFTPDSAEYVGGTIETSVQINPAHFSAAVGLSNYNINTGDALPTAFLHYNGAVNGEVLESTVEPVFTGMPEQSTAGTYTIVLSNAKEVLESLKAQPTAKNYTIQLWDKASLFISRYIQLPNAPASPVEGTTGRLLMEETFTNVPESLKAVGLDSVEKVTDKLLANVTGTTKDNTVVYDVHYSISADGQTWNALTPEQFPKEGLTITLPYPEGVDTKANDFTAMHMFTQDVNGFKTGDVEVIKAVKTDAGLQMTVKGFSPIAITWAKAGTTPPTDGGNGGNVVTPPTGGNGTTTQPTTPNPGTGAIAQTGDNSAVAVWGIVMALCATAAAGLMIMKSKGKKKQ